MKNLETIIQSVKSASDEEILMSIIPTIKSSDSSNLVKSVVLGVVENELKSRGIILK